MDGVIGERIGIEIVGLNEEAEKVHN